jgi:hypothetical protein
MAFLHFQSQDKHEWGFNVPDALIPVVGDVVMLPYAEPDKECEDSVEAVVKSREWWYSDEEDSEPELFLNVELTEPMADGCVPSSSEWPATEHSLRAEQLKRDLESIRRIGRVESP